MNDEITHFDTPEQAAYGLKLNIQDFIYNWFEGHDIFSDQQRNIIWEAVHRNGWSFFHDELLDHFEMCAVICPDRYIVHDDESITYECSM